jgi:hypothetical protein
VPQQIDMVEIIHAGAAESAVGRRESGRLDDVGLDAQTGAQPKNRSGILRDVGLKQGNAHGEPLGVHRGRNKISGAETTFVRFPCRTLGGLALLGQGCQ